MVIDTSEMDIDAAVRCAIDVVEARLEQQRAHIAVIELLGDAQLVLDGGHELALREIVDLAGERAFRVTVHAGARVRAGAEIGDGRNILRSRVADDQAAARVLERGACGGVWSTPQL